MTKIDVNDDIMMDPARGIIRFNSRSYRLDVDSRDKPMLVRIDEKAYDEMVERILKSVRGALDTDKLLRYCLNRTPYHNLLKIDEKMKKKRKPVMKTKDGCIELRVGGIDIPIAD